MFDFSVNHGGDLRRVWWRFKEPLQDDQKVAVVVVIDGSESWNTNPEAFTTDKIWGTVCEGDGTEDGVLDIYTDTGERPTANIGVEVRFYFDLSKTQPYGTTYVSGAPVPSKMVELDEVGLEMVPQPMTF